MKVFYYHRFARSGFHLHASSAAHIFYIPEENLILFKEQRGTFGGVEYSFTQRKELLEEARSVMQGSKVEGIEISNPKEFEYDSKKIERLIQDARSKSELEKKVRSGIEELLEKVER
jgi:hypothetical protein